MSERTHDRRQVAINFLTTVVMNMVKTSEREPANRTYYGELIDALTMLIHIARESKPIQWELMRKKDGE